MEQILLTPATKAELLSEFRSIVKEEMQQAQEIKISGMYLSSKEARSMFTPAISESTLWNWVNDGKIKKYNVGGKVVYKFAEITEAVENIKRYERAKA